MTQHIFKFPKPYLSKAKSKNITIILTNEEDFKSCLKDKILKAQCENTGYIAKAKTGFVAYKNNGAINQIFWGVGDDLTLLDGASLCDYIAKNISETVLKATSFELKIGSKFKKLDWESFYAGWGMAHYDAAIYNKSKKTLKPSLFLPKDCDTKLVTAIVEATSLLKNLINTPPNILGTDELTSAAKQLAKNYSATVKVIKDEQLEKQNFPMIYAVGKASPRRPQLVDLKWGKKSHPKITIVGKGIIYDTGGLNLKPGQYMRDMKKDMGGAAHALGVAAMIMALKLPIQLRVLLPIAENAVSGNAYRPGDILHTRKGLTVEIEDTDAEGRLVVADALTYACEEKPDLLIDFCTLTGAARVAVGYDIPAFFSNNDAYVEELRQISFKNNDPCWPFPLWKGYDSNINGDISDIRNEGTGRAGHIEAALFLQRFITPETDWIHLDCFAWERNGKPGRPKGGADTGMLAIFNLIKERYT